MRTLLAAAIIGSSIPGGAADLAPVVEIEEDVYTYTDANNGAGPMWCSGSSCLVRAGDRVFASGLETVPAAKPLNNCRWILFQRGAKRWERVRVDDRLTREPSPLASFRDGRVFLSANPTLGSGQEPNGGSAGPDVLEPPSSLGPVWEGTPPFTEHSYRSLAADSVTGELVLIQNGGVTDHKKPGTYRPVKASVSFR